MPSQKRKFGDTGEKTAEDYLISNGYKILDRNYQRPWGEIDIVAKRGELLIFVEVKTRDVVNVSSFPGELSINRLKIKKLQKICETYLFDKKKSPNQEWQIDVIAVSFDKISKKVEINHIENAVWDKRY